MASGGMIRLAESLKCQMATADHVQKSLEIMLAFILVMLSKENDIFRSNAQIVIFSRVKNNLQFFSYSFLIAILGCLIQVTYLFAPLSLAHSKPRSLEPLLDGLTVQPLAGSFR